MSGVHVLSQSAASQDKGPQPSVPGRRRPPNSDEQAKRKEWGAQWGKLLANEARKLRERNKT